MIVLDTNVLSKILRPKPTPAVLDWLVGPPMQPRRAAGRGADGPV